RVRGRGARAGARAVRRILRRRDRDRRRLYRIACFRKQNLPRTGGIRSEKDMTENHSLQGHVLASFTELVWGTTFVSTKVLLRAFSPLEIMIARFALGFLALLIVGRGLMKAQEKWHELLFAFAGLSGVTLYFL